MARRRLGHVPDWLSIGELRLVLDVFYGAFDSDSAHATLVASPWDQRKYPRASRSLNCAPGCQTNWSGYGMHRQLPKRIRDKGCMGVMHGNSGA